MEEIKIFKNTSTTKINELYNQYIINQNADEVILTIPNELKKYRFGLLGDILKLIITLNSKSKIHTVKFDIDASNVDKLYDEEYAYPVISFLWNVSKFIDKNNQDLKELLRKKQNDYYLLMNSLEKFKGQKYLISHTDHLSKSNGLIKFFENLDGFNDDEEYITEIIKRIFENNILKFNKNNSIEFKNVIEDVGPIVYELAKNTYEWGKTDANMKPISSSIRGVYFRFHNNGYESLLEEFKDTPIMDFFLHDYIKENCIQKYSYMSNNEKVEVSKIYYLEILVYDSGVGFIEKFNDSEGLTDIEIIKKCLIKNQTSSISNLKSKKGIGLDRILNIIDKKGFLKIMTDKYTIYRDLIKDNYSSLTLEQLNNLKLDDWHNKNFSDSDQKKCQGSYINILYPFKNTNL